MEHSDRILQILAERKITCYRVAKAAGLTSSMFNVWRKKPSSKIYSCNLVSIADYLGCSVDYLLGRTEDPELHQKQNAPKTASDGKVEMCIKDGGKDSDG